MYAIGLIEAGLTTLPERLRNTNKARALSRRFRIPPEHLLLDVSIFHDDMIREGIDLRRGRPDIAHQFLLVSQYSPLNMDGRLRVFIHTVDSRLVLVRPEARVPRNYHQFVGLVQRLFIQGRVPPAGKWLMKAISVRGLGEALSILKITKPILMHERGERLTCDRARELAYPPYAFLIGGFQRGDFSHDVLSTVAGTYSIKGGIPLDAWLVADRLIACLEGEVI